MEPTDYRDAADEPRRLSLPLIVGIYTLPAMFAWFLLRPGYSRHVRLGGFLLMTMSLVVAAARLTG